MSGKDDLNKAIRNLDIAIAKFNSSRGSLGTRVDQLESLVAELYSVIGTQSKTIATLIETNTALALKLNTIYARLETLNPLTKISKKPDPVN